MKEISFNYSGLYVRFMCYPEGIDVEVGKAGAIRYCAGWCLKS